LNELYRPFRVGNVITEANAELAVETLDGVEAGWEMTREAVTLTATGFVNELHDAVANVTLGRGPGTVPGVGFVPAGGVGRQRRNLELVRVRGFEIGARWRVAATADLRVDYLYSDAKVDRSGTSPDPDRDLDGRRLAQVPLHTLVAGLDWRPAERWRLGVQLRHVSEAFEDDMNELSLAPSSTVDVRIAYAVGGLRAGELFLAIENIGNETVVAGRDADGRRDLGAPRFTHGGVRWRW
jgi:outer membrane receptor protein involved in Fe transport